MYCEGGVFFDIISYYMLFIIIIIHCPEKNFYNIINHLDLTWNKDIIIFHYT